MPKKKRPEEKPADQFKRFIAAAKERSVDESSAGAAFSKLAIKRTARRSDRDDRKE